MIKQLLNSVITKYRDSSVSCSVLLFASAKLISSPLTNHDILVNLVQLLIACKYALLTQALK